MGMFNNKILVSGFAQTPKGIPANHSYKYIGVILLIDKDTHLIEKVDFSVIFSELTKEVLKENIKGFYINDSFSDFCEEIKKNISIPSIGAILQAVRAAIERYKEHIKK